jgi:hypothetical protein
MKTLIKSITKEEFRYIKNTNNKYLVSNFGRVFSLKSNRFLKSGIQKGGLLHVNIPIGINNKFVSKKIHQLVLEEFVGIREDNIVVRHLNGIPSDNRLENLAYGTHKDNSNDGIRLGETPKGTRNGRSKLNEEMVLSIRKLYETGIYTQKFLSEMFNVSRRHIGDIINRICWGWLHENIN